jgi:hypothetical protein
MRSRPFPGRATATLALRSLKIAAFASRLSAGIYLAFLVALAALPLFNRAAAADTSPATPLRVPAQVPQAVPSLVPAPVPTPALKPKAELSRATPPSTKSAPSAPVSRPRWTELTPAQQAALQPLAAEWDRLDSPRKKKWLELGSKFASLKPDQQARLQERMREWAKLTPDQRRVARESYSRAKKLNPSEKNAEWQHYQQLPEEQKKKLADEASVKKRVANLPPASQQKPKVNPPPKSALKANLQRRQSAGQKTEHHLLSPASGNRPTSSGATVPAGSLPPASLPVPGGTEALAPAVPPSSRPAGDTVTPSPSGAPAATSAGQPPSFR